MSTPTSTYTAPSPPGPPAPAVNLSRHSLLHRLECYYSLVSPSTIANTAQWKSNFELIYTKYGGSVEGECKLANKLMKKYGKRVLLLTVTQAATDKKSSALRRGGGERSHHHSSSTASSTSSSTQKQCHDESYNEINSNQEQQRRRNNSHIVDFASPHFDPIYTLYTAQEEEVIRVNNYLMTTQPSSSSQQQQRLLLRLDNISKFRSYLPTCDPLHIRNATTVANKANAIWNRNTPLEITTTTTSSTINNTATITNNNNDDSQQLQQQKKKKPSLFLSMVSQYETTSNGGGPLSLLYNITANRQRANIKIRNKHTVRGIITAYIFGFDKHFNLWCKDCCEEVYHHNIIVASSSSITTSGNNDDNCIKQQRQQKQLIEKQRYFHQLFIRGDNIVMIWRA